jgi:cellular nucleic acid-binding protein
MLIALIRLVGHIAEACASEMRLCYNCRQPGHESINCPSPRSTQAKQCYSCGGVGHIQADCPSIRVSGGMGAGQKCYVSAILFVVFFGP